MGNSVKEGYATIADLGDLELDVDFDKMLNGLDVGSGLENAINIGFENGMNRFAKLLEENFLKNLANEGLSGSDIAKDYEIRVNDDSLTLTVRTDYAIYVELGTGIEGMKSPHPKPQIPWMHDVNNHGEKGWLYEADDGSWHWTKGQKSRPFLYNTWRWARGSFTNIIKGAIRRELKKWGDGKK